MKHFTLLKTLTIALFLVTGMGSAWGQVSESFESGLPTSYSATTSYTLSSGTWSGSPDQVIRGTSGVNTGSYSCQLRSQTGAQITTPTLTGGVGTISFYVTASTASGGLQIRISTDDGANYTQVSGSPISFGTTKTFQSFEVNSSSVNKVQFYRTGATVYIDDVQISTFSGSGPADPQSFNAIASSASQIDLTATANTNSDEILVAYNTSNTFGAPSGTYSVGNSISGGGTVHYVGTADGLTNHTSLVPGTQYFYKAWSYDNSIEYSAGVEADATTLSTEPSNHPATFTATTNSSSQIDLSFSAASTITNAAGYLILQKTGSDPTGAPTNGIGYSVGNAIGDGTVAAIITNTSATSTSITGLDPSTTYHFAIFPYNWDGSNAATYNYKTDGTVPTANATTDPEPDNNTEVFAPISQIAAKDISSLVDTQGEAVDVFTITIEDQGSGDNLPTKVTNIRVKPHTTNTADWTDVIQGVFVDDGTDFVYPTATITDTYIDLAFGASDLNVADNSFINVTLYIYLNTTGIIDGQILSFMVDADDHGFTADASGSGFASTFLLGDFNSNDITVDVEATELTFTQQPSNVNVDAVMSPAVTVAFTDANGNIDVDYNGAGFGISLTTTGTFSGSATTEVDAANGVATFDNIIFSAAGTGITITTTDPDNNGWVNIQSNAFNVTDLPKLIISEVADPWDNFNGRFVELYNAGETVIDFNTTTIYFDRQANGGNHSSIQLTGSIGPKETYVIGNSSNINTIYGFNADLDFGSVTGNGDDGYFLFFDGNETTGTLMDAYGVIDVQATASDDWFYEDAKAVRNSNITSPNATWTASEWTITAADVDDCTPGEHNGNVSWKGGTGNWNTAANWSNGTVPSASDNIIIPDGASLSVDVAATVNNINVQSGGELTVNASQSLSVSGTITIEDGGSFINNGTLDDGGAKGDADAVMQRHIPAWTNNIPYQSDGWHLLASPVATFNIDGSPFDPGSLDDFYGWSETTWEWLNHKAGNPTQMIPGFGYLVAYESTSTKDFTGTFNNNDVTHTNLSVTPTEGNGWHLLGNPFQSALHWTNASGTWNPTNFETGAKILQDRTYIDITADGANQYIPANQGFFVKATNATNSITIPAAERVHNSTAFYKSTPANVLELMASDGINNKVKTWIQIMDDATAGFDEKYDMNFLGGMYQAPHLYSQLPNNERLSTNRIAPVEESTIVQLAFKSFHDVEYTISAKYVNSFDTDLDLILEDTQANIQVDLREVESYTFMASANELTERFKLHLLKATGISENNSLPGFSIYAHNSIVYLSSTNPATTRVELFNTTGQLVFAETMAVDGLVQLSPQVTAGWYVVKVSTPEGMATQKVFLK